MELVPNYFFIKDKLYRKIRVVKSEDYVVAWSYEDESRVRFNYSSVRREASKAFSVSEVAKLLGRKYLDIVSYLDRNLIDRPSGRLYNPKNKMPGKFMWSEQDVLDTRDAIFEMAPKNKYGEPYAGFNLVSKVELLAKMRQDTSYYVKNTEGDYVKVWRAL